MLGFGSCYPGPHSRLVNSILIDNFRCFYLPPVFIYSHHVTSPAMSHDSKTGKRKITTNKTKNKISVPAAMSEEAGGDGGGGIPLGGGTPGAGTNVNLEAYIWQENVEGLTLNVTRSICNIELIAIPSILSAGLVVMNVKWRGKTYCGAFIDIEKHNWQPPRYMSLS